MFHIKRSRENQNTHFTINNFIYLFIYFFFFENRAVYEIMWKNIEEPDRPTDYNMAHAIPCWIFKATNTQNM